MTEYVSTGYWAPGFADGDPVSGGVIWTPGKRERQPQAGAQLSDVGRSALFLASAGSERPLVVSGVAAKIASANGSTVAGGGHGFLATSTAVAQMSLKTAAGTQSSIALASGMSWTFLVHVKITAMNLPNPGFWRSGAGGAVGNTYCNVLSGRWPSIRTDGINVIAPSSGPELAVGFEGVIAYTNASARSAAIAWDGVVRHSATHSTAQTADTIEAFGFQYGPSESVSGVYYSIAMLPRAFSFKELEECTTVAGYYSLLFEPENDPVFYSLGGGATDYPVTATDAMTLADSASQTFAATGVAAEAMTLADSASNVASLGAAGSDALTLADSVSNVAALSATATDALSLADSASNVAALSATASDALTLADTLNATASGDYTATGSDALTLADSATNVASLGATGSDALTLADAASNTAALGATAADALTLADTLNASASGDYVVVATDALSLSDSVVAAYAAICIATDALSLADATSAAMAGQYAATATDALTLADAASNAAALGVSISEALTLAALVSAMLTGNTALTGTRGGYGVQMQLAARRAQIQTGRRRN